MIATTRSRLAAGIAAVAAALLTAAALAAPASATAYRYWSYWQGASGTWLAAQTGPGDHALVDRDVQGWRFGISTESLTASPDNAPAFAELCPDLAGSEQPEGQLRVAVVVDAGFVADAPAGQAPPPDRVACVTVPEGSTGNQALAAAATVTDRGGLVCSLDGYPEGECGAAVSDADAAAAAEAAATEQPNPASATAADADEASSTESGSSAGAVVGAVILAALIGAAFGIPALRRRTRAAR